MKSATGQPVPMVQRTLELFEAFARADGPMRLGELAEAIHMPVSSCHALVKTLEGRGYLYVSDKQIFPTRRLLDVSARTVDASPFLVAVRKMLERIQLATGETAVCGKRFGSDVLYVDVVEGSYPVRFKSEIGSLRPLYSSALGKACLSHLRPAAYAKLVAALPMAQITPRTITDRQALSDDIELGRRNGYFRTVGENVPDVLSLALPIRVEDEAVAIAVAGPIDRMQANQEQRLAALREAVEAPSR